MKVQDIKLNSKVVDRWYSFHTDHTMQWGVGKVLAIKKTRVVIQFDKLDRKVSFDHVHIRNFLLPYKKSYQNHFGMIPENGKIKKKK